MHGESWDEVSGVATRGQNSYSLLGLEDYVVSVKHAIFVSYILRTVLTVQSRTTVMVCAVW